MNTKNCLEEPHETHRSPLYWCAAVNYCCTEMYRKYYLKLMTRLSILITRL